MKCLQSVLNLKHKHVQIIDLLDVWVCRIGKRTFVLYCSTVCTNI